MPREFALDRDRRPLMPCSPAHTRRLLRRGPAVCRRATFTIILNDRAGGDFQPVAPHGDPGSRSTGLALGADAPRSQIKPQTKNP